jgi:hypothetical protein
VRRGHSLSRRNHESIQDAEYPYCTKVSRMLALIAPTGATRLR